MGNDRIDAGGGDDYVVGSDGADSLDGGPGNADLVVYLWSKSAVSVDLASGRSSGGTADGDTVSGFEQLAGSAHEDTLMGDAGANALYGKGGADLLRGRAGADRLFGEEGSDTADYSGSNAAVSVNLARATASGGHAAGDTLVGIENLVGSDHADTLGGGTGGSKLTGGGGADRFVLAAGHGDDTITDFTDGTDTIAFDASNRTTSFSQLTTRAHLGGTLVEFANEDGTLFLEGVGLALVNAADFVF